MAELENVNARSGSIAEPEQMEENNLIGNTDRPESAKRGTTSGHGQ